MTETNRLPTYHPDEFKVFNKALHALLERLLRYTQSQLTDQKIKRFLSSAELAEVRRLEGIAQTSLAAYKASFLKNGATLKEPETDIIFPNTELAQICDILLEAVKKAECVPEKYAPIVMPSELATEKFHGLADRLEVFNLKELIAFVCRRNREPSASLSGPGAMQ